MMAYELQLPNKHRFSKSEKKTRVKQMEHASTHDIRIYRQHLANYSKSVTQKYFSPLEVLYTYAIWKGKRLWSL